MKKSVISRLMMTFVCLFFMQSMAFAQQDNNVIDEVIWVVGDQAILKSDVEAERIRAQYEGRKWTGDPYCVIPEQLAIQKLYLHQAALDSIEVTDGDVASQVEQQMNFYIQQIGSKEKMEEYFNKNSTQIREQMRETLKEQMMVQQMQQKLVGDIKLTPADVRRYFKEIPQDSLPFIPTQVEVQIITQEPKIAQEEIDRVKKQLREYTEQVNSGKTQFSTLALLYSEDTASARQGGELGFMGRGELVTEYANVAFNLTDPKKVSKIVESEYGFHIIQLIEKRGDRVNSRHILMKPKVSEEALIESINRLDSVANDIRNGKFPFDEAATYLSSDKETRSNHGLLPNNNQQSSLFGTSRFEMQDLPQEVAKVVNKMQIGEVSEAFTMVNTKGKEVVAVVKLKNRIEGHKATMTEDYQRLKSIVVNKRRAEKLDNWIKEKQKATYIRINPEWVKCDFQYPGWIK
ncbi:MAG: peptidylprolyl isomerase [Bacteroidaceae bacterium]|nr:peptidylprolyl isomerase [Bacteroidaceae bacterium]